MCDSILKLNPPLFNAPNNENLSKINSQFVGSALSQMYGFYMDGKFTDFTLISCDRMNFNVHSVVLASACDYFQSVILEHGNSYTLKCVDSVTLVEVIRFCYLGEVRMSLDNVETIALAAHELKLESLKLKCSDFLESTLNSENYLQYALLADKCKLRASKEFAEKFFENNCTRICELKQINQWSTLQFDSFIEDLAKIKDGLFDELMKKVRSNENSALLTQLFSKDILQAIFRSFFIAGYVESMVNCRDQSNMNIKLNGLSTPMVIPKSTPSVNHLSDKGLLILTKNHNANTIEFYAISDSDCTRFSLPKYRINANGMNLSTLKIFPHKDRIYICYLMRNQRLEIKTWKFKSQLIAEVSLPAAVQYIKPRLITACGDEILVSEEKFVTWPSEGYKTTICKFGLESANYTNIEFVYDSLKEIICFGEDIFIFSSQKSNVASFNLNTRMRTSRGTLNNNGIVRAVIYRGRLYVGVFIRSQCTLFVEQFNRRNNQWKVIGSICTYLDATSFHIGATENYLYVFYGNGKVQRYHDKYDEWTALEFLDHFDQQVLCVCNIPFTCV